MAKCRCGVQFDYVGYGKRLCPTCMRRYKERRAQAAALPRCSRCRTQGVGLQRQQDGKTTCTACERDQQARNKQAALDRFADRLIDKGL